ncbi:hypothetical protein EIP86_001652 [Pleurotus ostreatoroseus]|nr:hypothetical protein EIP86_001652 [Pleurotus ostreatoroseus]
MFLTRSVQSPALWRSWHDTVLGEARQKPQVEVKIVVQAGKRSSDLARARPGTFGQAPLRAVFEWCVRGALAVPSPVAGNLHQPSGTHRLRDGGIDTQAGEVLGCRWHLVAQARFSKS